MPSGDHGVFFVDTTGWLAASDLTDGTHPNAEGSRKIAERLAIELRKRR